MLVLGVKSLLLRVHYERGPSALHMPRVPTDQRHKTSSLRPTTPDYSTDILQLTTVQVETVLTSRWTTGNGGGGGGCGCPCGCGAGGGRPEKRRYRAAAAFAERPRPGRALRLRRSSVLTPCCHSAGNACAWLFLVGTPLDWGTGQAMPPLMFSSGCSGAAADACCRSGATASAPCPSGMAADDTG